VLLAKIIRYLKYSGYTPTAADGGKRRGCAAAATSARREAIGVTFRAIISIPFRSFKLIW
jgi:hypothetical protein